MVRVLASAQRTCFNSLHLQIKWTFPFDRHWKWKLEQLLMKATRLSIIVQNNKKMKSLTFFDKIEKFWNYFSTKIDACVNFYMHQLILNYVDILQLISIKVPSWREFTFLQSGIFSRWISFKIYVSFSVRKNEILHARTCSAPLINWNFRQKLFQNIYI